MTLTHSLLPSLPSATKFPLGLSTVLVAVFVLGFGPAALAQESDDEERAIRVIVLGDGQIAEVGQDADNIRVRVEGLAVSAQERAREMADRVRPTLALHWGGAYLGVELVNLNEPLRAHFGVPEGSGVMVSNVVEDGPAARAGVQVGDIVTRFDGEDVTSSRKLTTMVRKAEAGDPADLEIWRDGKVETVSTTLDERPRPSLKANSFYFVRGREDLDGDGEVDVLIGPDNLDDLPGKIQEYFNGDEWRERHEQMQRFLHERRPDMKALEERLETLKKRLAELESRLEEGAEEN